MLKDRDALVSKHLFVQDANISLCIFAPMCQPPCHFSLCCSDLQPQWQSLHFSSFFSTFFLFFHESSVRSDFFCFQNGAIRRRQTGSLPAAPITLALTHCEVWKIFSFPMWTKQSVLSWKGEKDWNHSQRSLESHCVNIGTTPWPCSIRKPATRLIKLIVKVRNGNRLLRQSARMSQTLCFHVLTHECTGARRGSVARLVPGHIIVFLQAEFLSPSWTWVRPLCSGGQICWVWTSPLSPPPPPPPRSSAHRLI